MTLSPSTVVMWLLLSWCRALNASQTNLTCPPRNHMHTPHPSNSCSSCVSVCVRFGTWMCMHMRMHAHPSDVWNQTPPQRAGQVTPLPGCNRRLLWPLPRPSSLTPHLWYQRAAALTGRSADNQTVSMQGRRFQGRGQTGLVKRGFGLVTDHVATFTPPPLILAFHVNQTSEVFGCGYGACVDAVWRYTGLIVSLTNSCVSIHL